VLAKSERENFTTKWITEENVYKFVYLASARFYLFEIAGNVTHDNKRKKFTHAT